MFIYPNKLDFDLEKEMADFEKKRIVKLPWDYRQFILKCNGGFLDLNKNPFEEFESIEEFFGFLPEGEPSPGYGTYFSDFQTSLGREKSLFENLIRDNVLLFAITIEGYYLALNLVTSDVFLLDLENDERTYLCTGFKIFANSLRKQDENPLLDYDLWAKQFKQKNWRDPNEEDILAYNESVIEREEIIAGRNEIEVRIIKEKK